MGFEWLSQCYRTRARLFRDSNREDWIYWYPAPPGAKVFTDWSAFRSGVWTDTNEDPEWYPVGEVKGTRERIKNKQRPWVTGQCEVGSHDGFQFGFVLADLNLPPQGDCDCNRDFEVVRRRSWVTEGVDCDVHDTVKRCSRILEGELLQRRSWVTESYSHETDLADTVRRNSWVTIQQFPIANFTDIIKRRSWVTESYTPLPAPDRWDIIRRRCWVVDGIAASWYCLVEPPPAWYCLEDPPPQWYCLEDPE